MRESAKKVYKIVKDFKDGILTVKDVAKILQGRYIRILADKEAHQIIGYSEHYLIITNSKGTKSYNPKDVFFEDYLEDRKMTYLLPNFIIPLYE